MVRPVVILTFLTLTFAFSVVAKKGGVGHGRGQAQSDRSSSAVVVVRFAPTEVRVIHEYYAAHPANLPPGLRKKLARTGTLPPGWQKRFHPFPEYLEARLPPLCDYCGRGVVDGCAVIYDKRTRIILDVVQLVGDIVR